ncbi:MAG TPA: RT0821/Lpp0805 family surface protein [Azospirillaceae bacterium]|nr:RT0821/Lpp0805 family surface protein [Azospirillaceae bacterium]
MSHRLRTAAASLALALSLTACAETGSRDTTAGVSNKTIGTVGGAAGGALIGSQFGKGSGKTAATILGGVLGALAGREIADRLSDDDRDRAATAERTAVARNETITWNNPDTGNRGTIQPRRTYTSNDGRTCRDYSHTVYVNGQPQEANGTACRQEDGTWTLVG